MKSISDIIAPISLEEFHSEYYEKKPLIVDRGNPEFYHTLLTVQDIDRLLSSETLTFPKTKMTRYAAEVPPEEYVTNNVVNPSSFLRHFHDGATMVFSGLHERFEALGYLCDCLTRDLYHRFQTNIYFTPNNSQGFPAHYDTHDVFILQVAGSKKWKVYESAIELPNKSQTFAKGSVEPGAILHEFVLNAGDLLYIPRGFMHEGSTNNDISLHITLGFMGITWAEYMIDTILDLAKRNPELRRNLPWSYSKEMIQTEEADRIKNILIPTIMNDALTGQTCQRMYDEMIAGFRPKLGGQLAQILSLEKINQNTQLQVRDNAFFKFIEHGEELIIRFAGRAIKLPLPVRPAVEWTLHQSGSFKAMEIGGDLDDDGKLVLAKRLVKEGLLVAESIEESVSI